MNDNLMLFEGEKILIDCPAQPSQIYGIMISIIPFILIFISFISFFCAFFFGAIFQAATLHSNQMPHVDVHKVIGIILAISTFFILLTYFSSISAIAKSRYICTNQRCIIINGSGFRGVDKKAIPYGRIADVNIYQGFIDSFFGIANLLIDEQMAGLPTSIMANNRNTATGLLMKDAESISRLISEQVSKKS